MSGKEKKEKKKGSSNRDDGVKKGKKERTPKEERPPPTHEAVQGVLSAPIIALPIALDAYVSLIDANARSLLTNSASEPLAYPELARNLVTLETSLTSLFGRMQREYAEPLKARSNFPASSWTLLFGSLETLTRISGRLIGVYESSTGVGGVAERLRRKLSDVETTYGHVAYTYQQITSTVFNLEQDKQWADIMKVDGKPALAFMFAALLHYPTHSFALWREYLDVTFNLRITSMLLVAAEIGHSLTPCIQRLKLDEYRASPEASRLIVDYDRIVKAIRTQYDLGQGAVKIQELNSRITNQDQAKLLAGNDMRQLLLQFAGKVNGSKKEVALLSDGIMYFKPAVDSKLEYESFTPLAEIQRLETSPTTNVLRVHLSSKSCDICPISAEVTAIAKLMIKTVPRITETVSVIQTSPRDGTKSPNPDIKVDAPAHSASKTPETGREGLKSSAAAELKPSDAKRDPKRPTTPVKGRSETPPTAVMTPASKLKDKERNEQSGKSPLRGVSPLRKRSDGVGVMVAGEDEVVLHEDDMSSSDILNTDEPLGDAPELGKSGAEKDNSATTKDRDHSGKGAQKEKDREEKEEGGWGNMIVSFFKGEQNVGQIKRKTDPSHKHPMMINTVEDFPREIKSLLKGTGIPPEKFEKNLTTLSNVLYFTTHRNFVTKESRERRKADKLNPHVLMFERPLTPETLPEGSPGKLFEEEARIELAKEDNPRRLYKLAQQAGKGGFGKVYDARINAPNGKHVAVKRMANVAEKDRMRNTSEIGALKLCKHPNIVEYHAAYKVQDEVWLVMEFMEGGTLTEAAKAHNFTEKEIAFVSREILKAISFLHAKMVVHRDLKSSNVMMSTTGDIKLSKMAGSPYWMPPEMIHRNQYGLAIDIWSFAVCIIELANRSPPNKSNPIKAMFLTATDGIKHPLDNTSQWSKEIREFLSLSLMMDPEKRATAPQLLAHEFLKKAEDHKNMEKVLSSIFLHNTLAVLGTGFG